MTEALAVQTPGVLLAPVMNVALAKERLVQLQQFVKEYLVDGEDFGIIPGTPKPTLYKPGADKLCELYGLADEYEVTQRTEDFEKGLFDYEVKCILLRKPDMTLVSSGLGSCNSYETKYRWRDSKRLCPSCGKDAIIKGKEEYGGGWLCFGKKGGCGAKFADNDPAIVGQIVGRTQNEDIADIKNTILKMAKKRAKVDAILSATRSSGVFTQDLDDIPKWEPPSDTISHQEKPPQPAPEPQTVQGSNQRPAQAPGGTQTQPGYTKRTGKDGLIATVKRLEDVPGREKTATSRAVNPYVKVHLLSDYQGCSWASCFDSKFWPCLHEAVGLQCEFQIVEKENNGKTFLNIEDVRMIAGEEYVDGKAILPEGAAQ